MLTNKMHEALRLFIQLHHLFLHYRLAARRGASWAMLRGRIQVDGKIVILREDFGSFLALKTATIYMRSA